jgi:hypothetical protein
MKKLTLGICAAAALLIGVVAPQDAEAQQITQISPTITARLIKVLSTKVSGNINVAIPSQLQGLQCSDITLVAASVEMLPPPPGGFATQHKWTRTTTLSGNTLNNCSYSMSVVGNSAFNLYLGGESTDKCQLVSGYPSPDSYVKVTVPTGTTKNFNFSATMTCQNIY